MLCAALLCRLPRLRLVCVHVESTVLLSSLAETGPVLCVAMFRVSESCFTHDKRELREEKSGEKGGTLRRRLQINRVGLTSHCMLHVHRISASMPVQRVERRTLLSLECALSPRVSFQFHPHSCCYYCTSPLRSSPLLSSEVSSSRDLPLTLSSRTLRSSRVAHSQLRREYES